MHVDTLRFGTVVVDYEKIIDFVDGIPGFEQFKRYALLQFEESYPIVWLQAMEDAGVCFPVLDTFNVLPDYVFDIDDIDVNTLEINSPDELHVINIVVIPEDIHGMTVNLSAPIIINTFTGKAKQIILNDDEYNVKTPVFQQICKLITREGDDDDVNSVEETE